MTILDYAKDVFIHPEKYAKFWVAAGGFVVSLITTYFGDAEWLPAFISALSAIGVFSVPNKK